MKCPNCEYEFQIKIVGKKKKVSAPAPKADFSEWTSWPSEVIKTKNGSVTRYWLPYKFEMVYSLHGEPNYFVSSPEARIVCAYKKRKGTVPWDRSWDKADFPRYKKVAKELLRKLGDWQQALRCLADCQTYYDSQGLPWKLETVVKNAMDWKYGKLEPRGKISV